MKSNAKRIRSLRKKSGLLQHQLAKKLYVDGKSLNTKTIQRMENLENGKISPKNLEKLAEFFKVDSDDLIIQSANNNKTVSKVFYLRRLMKAEELYDVLRSYNINIKFDYSIYITGKETMNLVKEFLIESYELHLQLTGKKKKDKKTSPSRGKFDITLAPILAGLHENNVGIFVKQFCAVKIAQMDLKEYEAALKGVVSPGDYIKTSDFEERKSVLFIYAAKIKKVEEIPYSDPSRYDIESIKLSEEYLLNKFRSIQYTDKIFADDSIDTPFQRKPDQDRISYNSELYGFLQYMTEKEKNDYDYYMKFWHSDYFKSVQEQMAHWMEEATWGIDSDEKGEMIRVKNVYNEKDLDKDSIENGKKLAAQFWNAWDIFNKRAPYWDNKWIKFQEEDFISNNKHFPNVKSQHWFGPEDTVIKIYYRKRVNTKIILGEEDSQAYDSFVTEDGEELGPITQGNDGEYYIENIQIYDDMDFIPVYEPTEKFMAKVNKFLEDIKNNELKAYEEINKEDLVAYEEANKKNQPLPF